MRAHLRRLGAHHRRLAVDAESGTSLIELLVGMIIMTTCGAITTTAIITLFRVSNAAQAVTNSAQQTNQAFQTLDRTVRYASAVSTEAQGSTSSDWHVELRNTTDGTEKCAQLRLNTATGLLQRRTWTVSDTSPYYTSLTSWTTLASGLTNGAVTSASGRPFRVVNNTGSTTANHQTITFNLVSKAGLVTKTSTSTSTFTLTALNSTADASSDSVCQQVSVS